MFLQEMNFDLGDAVKWEYLLYGTTGQSLLLIPDMKKQQEAEDDEEVQSQFRTPSLTLLLNSALVHFTLDSAHPLWHWPCGNK